MNKYILLALFCVGCGPQGPTPKELREQTISTLNVTANAWKGEPDFTTEAVDAWGNKVTVRIEKGKYDYYLTLTSAGPDGLPQNSDDIKVQRIVRHTKPEPVSKSVEKGAESFSHGWFKGAVTGVKDGLKKDVKDEK